MSSCLVTVGVTRETLCLQPGDLIEVDADPQGVAPRSGVEVRIRRADGSTHGFEAVAAVETSLEVEVLRAGGLLPMLLAMAVGGAKAAA